MKPLVLLAAVLSLPPRARAAADPAFDGGGPALEAPEAPQAAPALGPAATLDDRSWVIVHAASPEQRTKIASAGVALEAIRPGQVAGVASAHAVARLRRLGLAFSAQPLSQRLQALDFPASDKAFHDYDRMTAEL